jgi:hypothetical protein
MRNARGRGYCLIGPRGGAQESRAGHCSVVGAVARASGDCLGCKSASRSREDLHASGIRKYLHHGVGPQAPAFPIPAPVKGHPNGLRDPPHVAVASDARCDRRGKPVKSIDYLTCKDRSGGTRIHVVHGHDNFVGRIVVDPDVELIIAESRRPGQRQRKTEHIDRSTTSPTHSRYSKSQMADARRNGGMDQLVKGDWHAQAHGKHTVADAARPGYTRRTTSEAHGSRRSVSHR